MDNLVKQLRALDDRVWGTKSLTDEMLRRQAADRIEQLEAQLAAATNGIEKQ